MHNKRWVISSPITPEAEEALVRFPPILKQILFNRGLANYEEARAFLRAVPSFDTNPYHLTGMEATVDRIIFAIQNSEPIAVYGDYDVDGVTATALLEGFGSPPSVGRVLFSEYMVPCLHLLRARYRRA